MSVVLLSIGLSFRTAPVDLLGGCSFRGEATRDLLRDLTARDGISEAVALSTCNRTELYLAVLHPLAAHQAVLDLLAQASGHDRGRIADSLYAYRGEHAVRHLFRVASSLDSMIVGESEIQGQVRRAWELASGEATTGPVLDPLFRSALEAGKRVRRSTRIGVGRLSVPSVALDLVAGAGGMPADHHALIVGAGQMSRLVARGLVAAGVRNGVVASRNLGKARALAEPAGWSATTLASLDLELAGADLVFSATAASRWVILHAHVAGAMASRPYRPLALVDLAVPRDVDPAVQAIPGVTLLDMETIRRLAAERSAERIREAVAAEAVVDREVARYVGRWDQGAAVVAGRSGPEPSGADSVSPSARHDIHRLDQWSQRGRGRPAKRG